MKLSTKKQVKVEKMGSYLKTSRIGRNPRLLVLALTFLGLKRVKKSTIGYWLAKNT